MAPVSGPPALPAPAFLEVEERLVARQRFEEAGAVLDTARQQSAETRRLFQEAEQESQTARSRALETRQQLEIAVQELRAGQERAQALRDQHQQAESLLAEARSQASDIRQHLEETGHELDLAHEFVEKTRKRSQEAGAKFQEAASLLDGARQQADQVRQQLPDVEQQVQQSRAQLEEARQECDRAHESLQGVQQEAARIRVHLEEVRTAVREEASHVREQFQEVHQELTNAEQEGAILRRQIEAVRQLREELERVVRQRQQDGPPKPPELPTALPRPVPPEGRERQPVAVTAPVLEPTGTVAATETAAPSTAGPQEVIFARVRAETRQERLARYLHEAWAVENGLEETFRKMADEVIDPEIKTLFDSQRRQSEEQRDRLVNRIRDLGSAPSAGGNPFSRLVASIWEALQRTPDDFDRSTQNLMKGFAADQFCAAMYQALEVYATAAEDPQTALLAAQARQQKQEDSNQMWMLLTPMAIRPAQVDVLAAPAAFKPAPDAPFGEEVVSVRDGETQSTNTVPPEAGVP